MLKNAGSPAYNAPHLEMDGKNGEGVVSILGIVVIAESPRCVLRGFPTLPIVDIGSRAPYISEAHAKYILPSR